MSTPKYFISLGGVNLHRVMSFELTSARDINDYDGIGSGKFNVPDSQKPREWTIQCELLQDGKELSGLSTWSASELFKTFETWLGKTDAPIRMVKTDSIYPAANISVLVWLKSYHPKESDDQGVYDTEIVVAEYKPVGIKTTGIPTVSRPGKVPVPAKVTITKSNTVYKTAKKLTGSATSGSVAALRLADTKTGKPATNPASVTSGSSWNVGTKKGSITTPTDNSYSTDTGMLLKNAAYKTGRFDPDAFDTWTKNVSSTFNSIGKAIGNFILAGGRPK